MDNELEQRLQDILNDKNTNLTPENVKQGVSVLGIEGTYVDSSIYVLDSELADLIINGISAKDSYTITPEGNESYVSTGSELLNIVSNTNTTKILVLKSSKGSQYYISTWCAIIDNNDTIIFTIKNTTIGVIAMISLNSDKAISSIYLTPFSEMTNKDVETIVSQVINKTDTLIVSSIEPTRNK